MKYMLNHHTNITHRTDGARVWWWSSNLGTWFPEPTAPDWLDNAVSTGNGSWVKDPESKAGGDVRKIAYTDTINAIIVSLLSCNIDPRDFTRAVDHCMTMAAPRRCAQLYVDYIHGATAEDWQYFSNEAHISYAMRKHYAAQALFAAMGTPNPFDYAINTARGMYE